MSDIQPGDVVVCVDVSPCAPGYSPPRRVMAGRVYRVSRTFFDLGSPLLLALDGVVADTISGGYACYRFRKIEAPRTELSERIRKCRPVMVPA